MVPQNLWKIVPRLFPHMKTHSRSRLGYEMAQGLHRPHLCGCILYSVTVLYIFYCHIIGKNEESVASTGLDVYHSWTLKMEDWNKRVQNV